MSDKRKAVFVFDERSKAGVAENFQAQSSLVPAPGSAGTALAEANDYDSAAEGENSANFRHKRKEFDELATRAARMLPNEKGQR